MRTLPRLDSEPPRNIVQLITDVVTIDHVSSGRSEHCLRTVIAQRVQGLPRR